MPTNNKTTNLQLNSWLGTDKPTRTDFVNDNTIIDTTLGNHLASTTLHFTTSEKAWLTSPYQMGSYVGLGDATQTVTFSFNPKMVIVYKKNVPPCFYDSTNSKNLCYFAIALPAGASSGGASLSNNVMTVQNTTDTPSNGYYYRLCENYGQYEYIAFK